jgi:hypothetical protein
VLGIRPRYTRPVLRHDARVLYLTQLIYLHDGQEQPFLAFEDAVLPLLAKYNGELVLRLRPDAAAKIAGSAEPPYEVHVLRFASELDLARFAADEERQRALRLKDQSVRESVLIRGMLA